MCVCLTPMSTTYVTVGTVSVLTVWEPCLCCDAVDSVGALCCDAVDSVGALCVL